MGTQVPQELIDLTERLAAVYREQGEAHRAWQQFGQVRTKAQRDASEALQRKARTLGDEHTRLLRERNARAAALGMSLDDLREAMRARREGASRGAYLMVKREYGEGVIVLFRVGDFLEAHYEDAEVVARECGIRLLSKPRTMAGFPYHASQVYISTLTSKGYRVAVVEPTTDDL